MDSLSNKPPSNPRSTASPQSQTTPPVSPTQSTVPTVNPANSTQSPSLTQPKNTLAIVALILSFFIPIAGLICGIIANNKIKKTGGINGRGLAISAIIISIVLMALQTLFIFLFIYSLSNSSSTRIYTPSSSSSIPSDNSSASQPSSPSTSSTNSDEILKNSQADATLRLDLIKAIAIKEKIAGRNGALEIISITKQPKHGNGFVENWEVKVDDVNTTYLITLTPTSDGGTDYKVQSL